MASLDTAPDRIQVGLLTISSWRQRTSRHSLLRNDGVLNAALLWAVRVGVLLLFVTPLVVTTSTVFPFIVGKAIWSRSVIEIIFGLYVILAIRVPEFRPTRSRLVLLLGLHLVAVFVAGVFGSSFNLSFWSNYERMSGIFDLAHWITLSAVLIFTVRGLREWKAFASLSLVFGLAAAFLGLAEKFDYEIVSYLQGAKRISGATGNPSFLAGHMMVNTLLALALLGDRLKGGSLDRNWAGIGLVVFYLFTAVVSIWVLSETGTRGSMLGLFVGLTVGVGSYAFFSRRQRIRNVAIVMTVAVPIAVIVLLVARDTSIVQSIAARNNFVDRVVSTSFSDGSVGLRATGLRISGEAFLARPLTGWGGENFEVPYQRYQRQFEVPFGKPMLDRAHNKPLDLLATTGVLGFATYLALWGWIGTLAWRRLQRDTDNRILHAGVAGTLAALFIHELFLFDTAVTALLFVLLVTWASGGERGTRSSVKPLLDLSRLSPFVRLMLRRTAPIAVGLVVLAVLFGVNLRMYRAAQAITRTGANVGEVTANLDEFGPLATFGRERLLNVMARRIDTLNDFEKIELILQMEAVAEQALALEPENMDLHYAIARFYRAAGPTFPEMFERARLYLNLGYELGPHTGNTANAFGTQLEAEMAFLWGDSQG